ncbi:FecR family protein [Steroidobacter sp.]|uniref:FecR family protein n=1 Tax=Steroidobacter sp. TaxID=1978227 RepID=UPI001A57CE0C|nr:FecR family protein [Steroidobacter sp.]MBL8271980.1 FecR family protein [Steroidobacter sp.]
MNTPRDDRERQLRQQAAQWVCDLPGAPPEKQAEFMQWLKSSPQHVNEYLLTQTLWQDIRDAAASDSTDLDALTAEVLASGTDTNVVPLPTSRPEPVAVAPAPAERRLSKGALWGVAASFAVMAFVASAWMGWRAYTGPTYVTAVGEQRTLPLPDGSLLQLNTHTRVQIRFTHRYRDVRLLEGEAFFSVQRDTARPFRVQSGDTVVQAVGTQFNVYRTGEQTRVAVLEGRVKILEREVEPQPGAAPQLLDAGEKASIAAGRPMIKKSNEDVAAAVSWRQRKLVFSGERLEAVAAEFNRYNQRHIVVEDSAAQAKLLSGTFNADDPDSLMLFLGRLDDLSVQTTDSAFVIRAR